MRAEPRIPRATYRLQLGPELDFDAVAALAPYLAELGVSHAYLSPVLQAVPGSLHGYDVVDHGRVSEVLGGAAGFARLCAALRAAGLGLVLDVVPNHMSIAHPRSNPRWWDVLMHGAASASAHWFDIDWQRGEPTGERVLLPILADHYGRVLASGALRALRAGGEFLVRVGEQELPAAPDSLGELLARAARAAPCPELGFAADVLAGLPGTGAGAAGRARRLRDHAVAQRLLGEQLGADGPAARAVDVELAQLNADRAALHAFLERQHYRLAYWRCASDELDYRRFFDVSSLAGLRMEDEGVFRESHALPLRWLEQGLVDGLRIDHPDGLRDPAQYLARLASAAPRAWRVVEKVLQRGERLPADWPVHGTSGYEFLACAGGLFVDPAGEVPLGELCTQFTGEPPLPFAELARRSKRQVLRELLASELARLREVAVRVCELHLEHRDYTRAQLSEALAELLVQLPVYRSYAVAGQPLRAVDRELLERAAAAARAVCTKLEPELFEFLLRVLCAAAPGSAEAELQSRFQQLCASLTAKGVEDTAFYRSLRLVCLNEVGGDPGHFGTRSGEFHRLCMGALARWPHGMTATTTHDTKRSEDARLRIAVLSEVPERWRAVVGEWSALCARHRAAEGVPSRAAEYLLYQTLVGCWPIEPPRLLAYMSKAAREAKQETFWASPDERYERALAAFCTGVLGDAEFTRSVEAFVAPLRELARVYSLAQLLLKLCAPGVPDFYQGAEFCEDRLTDPDNRQAVDFAARAARLRELDGLSPEQVWASGDCDLRKLWITRRGLALRAERPHWFGAQASYAPLALRGAHADCALGFLRAERLALVVPRRLLALGGDWRDSAVALPAGEWRHLLLGGPPLRGGALPLRELFARCPLALLERV